LRPGTPRNGVERLDQPALRVLDGAVPRALATVRSLAGLLALIALALAGEAGHRWT